VTSLFVYKCRNDPDTTNAAYGDWGSTLKRKAPFVWGGAWATRSAYSRRLFEDEVGVGDLILAWQVDKQGAVGVCEVTGFKSTQRGQEIKLKWVEVFPSLVPINVMKRNNRRLDAVKAFRQGFTATLYGTTKKEAYALLDACGSSLASRFNP
jgi:hypothetical protein